MVITYGTPFGRICPPERRSELDAANNAWEKSITGQGVVVNRTGDYLGEVIGVNTTSVRLSTGNTINIGALAEYSFVPARKNQEGENE